MEANKFFDEFNKIFTSDLASIIKLEFSSLSLFLYLIVPGFVSIKLYQLIYPAVRKDVKDILIDTVTYSILNFLVAYLPMVWFRKLTINHFLFDYIGLILFIFVSPVIICLIWKFIRELDFVQNLIPHPTENPWDFVFRQRGNFYVVVELNNGKKIAGLYSSNSFVSNSPAPPEIYIQTEWTVNESNVFISEVNGSKGALITRDKISSVHFFEAIEVPKSFVLKGQNIVS